MITKTNSNFHGGLPSSRLLHRPSERVVHRAERMLARHKRKEAMAKRIAASKAALKPNALPAVSQVGLIAKAFAFAKKAFARFL